MTKLALARAETGISLSGRVRPTPTGLDLPEDLSQEEWLEVGQTLLVAERATWWWIGDWYAFGEDRYETSEVLAKTIGHAGASLRRAGWVSRTFEPYRRRYDDLSWSHYAEAAGLKTEEEQDLWLQRAQDEHLSKQELRGGIQRAGIVINVDEPVLPDGPFDVIYADPPWRYGDGIVTSGVVRSIDSHYPTMELEDIHALPVADMASPDAVLFLWATNPLLPDALSTMAAWGFEYHDHFVWVKVKDEGKLPPEERAPTGTVIPGKMGLGVLVRRQHELLLIGFRGNPGNPVPQALHRSVVAAPYRGHSVKPVEFYDIIEGMYPRASRVELFARAARRGWASYGNQAPMLG